MYKKLVVMILALALIPFAAVAAEKKVTKEQPKAKAKGPRVLFLSNSEGFQHGPVTRTDGKPSPAEAAFVKMESECGGTIVCTKNATKVSAEFLKDFDIVMLYTQGDICQQPKSGLDGNPMSEQGKKDFFEWIKNGGRVIGFHCATDTFHSVGDKVSEFSQIIGAEFAGHGTPFEGALKVVDTAHPAAKNIPQGWKRMEEWYTFKNWNKSMHVIAMLNPGEERAKQAKIYGGPDYPVIWTNAVGKGKVYYTAYGHFDETFSDPSFIKTIVDAQNWIMQPGLAGTEPNYEKVVK